MVQRANHQRTPANLVRQPVSMKSVAALVVSAGTIVLTGCGNAEVEARNAASAQIENATSQLSTIALQTAFPMNEERRTRQRQLYSSLYQDVSNVSSQALPVQQANLHAMAAEAQIALANLSLDEAREIELGASRVLRETMQLVGLAVELKSMADANAAVDFSVARSAIDQRQDASETRTRDLNEEAVKLDQRIEELRAEVAREITAFQEGQDAAALKRDEADGAPLNQQADLIVMSARMAREADAHQVRAAGLEAQLDALVPERDSLQSRIDQAETEIRSFDLSREVLTRREANARQEHDTQQQELQQLITRVNERASEMANSYLTDFVAKCDEALNHAEQAKSKAGSAAQNSVAGRLRLVLAGQGLAQAHWRKAQALREFAFALEALVAHAELLGAQSERETMLAQVQSDIEAALTEAAQAYRDAVSDAESLSNNEIDAEVKTDLLTRLNRSIGLLTGEEVAELPMPDETAVGDDMSTGFDVQTPAAPAESPAALVRQLIEASQNGIAGPIFASLEPKGPTEREYLSATEALIAPADRLNQACLDQFGQTFNAILMNTPQMRALADQGMSQSFGGGEEYMGALAEMAPEDVEQLDFAYDSAGTTSWVTNDVDLMDIMFVQVGGQWKLQFDLANMPGMDQMGGAEGMAEMAIEMTKAFAQPMAAMFEDLTVRVQAGEFATANDLATEFINSLTANTGGGPGG